MQSISGANKPQLIFYNPIDVICSSHIEQNVFDDIDRFVENYYEDDDDDGDEEDEDGGYSTLRVNCLIEYSTNLSN